MAKSRLTLVDVASQALVKDLAGALSAPPEILRCIAEELDKDRGFRLLDEDRVIKAWADAGLAADKLKDVFSVLGHIFGFGVTSQRTTDELLNEIEQLCSRHNLSGFEERRNELRDVLGASEHYLQRRELLPWARAVFPILVGVEDSVELRGAFKSTKSEELVGLVPLAILQLSIKYEDDEKSQTQRIGIQLTEEDINTLSEALGRARRRLTGIKGKVKGTGVLVPDHALKGQWKEEKQMVSDRLSGHLRRVGYLSEADVKSMVEVLKALGQVSPDIGRIGETKIDLPIKIEFHEHKYYLGSAAGPEQRQYAPTLRFTTEPLLSDEEERALSLWRSELSHFETVRPQLWRDKRYRNKYVAMRRRRVVDADSNKFALARRMAQRFPGDVVLVTRVQVSVSVVELPSPEVD